MATLPAGFTQGSQYGTSYDDLLSALTGGRPDDLQALAASPQWLGLINQFGGLREQGNGLLGLDNTPQLQAALRQMVGDGITTTIGQGGSQYSTNIVGSNGNTLQNDVSEHRSGSQDWIRTAVPLALAGMIGAGLYGAASGGAAGGAEAAGAAGSAGSGAAGGGAGTITGGTGFGAATGGGTGAGLSATTGSGLTLAGSGTGAAGAGIVPAAGTWGTVGTTAAGSGGGLLSQAWDAYNNTPGVSSLVNRAATSAVGGLLGGVAGNQQGAAQPDYSGLLNGNTQGFNASPRWTPMQVQTPNITMPTTGQSNDGLWRFMQTKQRQGGK